ncbi:hypothetical protein WHR41_06362 [Cladosporium halotolerans]|uniref:S-adenosyl-L-methionine-dependent methyltransferase n=1 Tax=Cladosporium halotolerans TaxID=1052096 RepID=A0AB34KK20_9PEZI
MLSDDAAEAVVEAPRPAEEGLFGDFEVDEGDGDGERDSSYGGEVESITTSISDSAIDYKFEHGRRYHAFQDGKYHLPNDDEEIVRLELQHLIWRQCLSNRLHLCPTPNPLRTVLDIGCGTGAWAIDFAEVHPATRVIGVDLSPIQPTAVPPNVEFLVDDITAPWIFDQPFDYIHSRAITIGVRDWGALVAEVWRNLAPGGWVEFQEYHAPFVSDDGTIARCAAFERWNGLLLEAAGKAGVRLDAIVGVPGVLAERGFVNVGRAATKWPVGPWAKGQREKRLGEMVLDDVAGGLEGFSMRMFTKVLGWSREEVMELLEQVSLDMRSGKMHAYLPIDFLWAQKPLDATEE